MIDHSSPPRRLTRAESKERTLDALLTAAQRIFVQLGYQGSTLDAVAAEAGFTKGAVYAHFKSKEQILCLLFERALERDTARLEHLLDSAADSVAVARDIGNYVDGVDDRDAMPSLALELQIEARGNASLADKFNAAMASHEERIARVIERFFNMIGARPPMDADRLAEMIVSVVVGVALSRKSRRSTSLSSGPVIRALLGLPLEETTLSADAVGEGR